ncbi:MAG: serine/threonine protein kinase [Deltaproteobacteria bacterium]|nr:serine/threonine protein kinase [Deltaproteobacteria bacterium]
MTQDVFGISGITLSGAFLVEEPIAEGGFGVVYRAEHIAFRAKVALKCLKIPASMTAEQKEAFIEKFREEAEMLFHLSGQIPEVVRPLHADAVALANGTLMPYIAMEWVDGTPLDSVILAREDAGQPPMSLAEAVRMLAPIANALQRSHFFEVAGGAPLCIAHCDLKPENILVLDHGAVRAKLLDFGIAKAREIATTSVGHMTASDAAHSFTPGYGSPEQWLPKSYGATGPWTDVWALAVTLVECITGKPPIDGDLQAMMGTTIDPNRRPTPRNEGAIVSDAVEKVFERALAVDPKKRYAQMKAFWSDLERAMAGGASAAAGRPLREDSISDSQRSSAAHSGPRVSVTPRGAVDGPDFDLELDLTPGIDQVQLAGPMPTSARAPAASAPNPTSARPAASPAAQPAAPAAIEPASFEMDLGPGVVARPAAPRAGAAPAARPAAARPQAPVVVAERGRQSLVRSAVAVVVGLALVGVDIAMGQKLVVAGVRVRWIGALLAGIGIVMALASLAASDDD